MTEKTGRGGEGGRMPAFTQRTAAVAMGSGQAMASQEDRERMDGIDSRAQPWQHNGGLASGRCALWRVCGGEMRDGEGKKGKEGRMRCGAGDLDELDGGVVGAEVAAEGEEEDGRARDVGRVVEVARPEGRQPAPAPQAQAPADRVRLPSRSRRQAPQTSGAKSVHADRQFGSGSSAIEEDSLRRSPKTTNRRTLAGVRLPGETRHGWVHGTVEGRWEGGEGRAGVDKVQVVIADDLRCSIGKAENFAWVEKEGRWWWWWGCRRVDGRACTAAHSASTHTSPAAAKSRTSRGRSKPRGTVHVNRMCRHAGGRSGAAQSAQAAMKPLGRRGWSGGASAAHRDGVSVLVRGPRLPDPQPRVVHGRGRRGGVGRGGVLLEAAGEGAARPLPRVGPRPHKRRPAAGLG